MSSQRVSVHPGAAGCICIPAGLTIGIAYGLFFFSHSDFQELSVGVTCASWGALGGLVGGVMTGLVCRKFSRATPIMFAVAMSCFIAAVGAIIAWSPGERRSMEEGINLRSTWMGWGAAIGGAIGLVFALSEIFGFTNFHNRHELKKVD